MAALQLSVLVATLRLSPEDIMEEIRRKLAGEAKRKQEKERLGEMKDSEAGLLYALTEYVIK